MTTNEFKAWLEGYMVDRANPDPHVIAKKAAEISQAFDLPPRLNVGPYYPPTHVYPPNIGSASPPYVQPFTVTCQMEPLGADFEAVWDRNAASLYQS